MKKILLSALLLLMTSAIAMASMSDDRPVTLAQLPQTAQQFIKQYFPAATVSYAKQDTDMFDGDYEVYFTDGNKVEFRKNGEWKDVECKMSEIPAGIVPPRILAYVAQNYAGQKVVEINRDTRDFEVKLSNGLDLEFSLAGDFLRLDD